MACPPHLLESHDRLLGHDAIGPTQPWLNFLLSVVWLLPYHELVVKLVTSQGLGLALRIFPGCGGGLISRYANDCTAYIPGHIDYGCRSEVRTNKLLWT